MVDGPAPAGAGAGGAGAEGSATAKALDYSLNRWVALKRYREDPRLPIEKQPRRAANQALDDWQEELAARRKLAAGKRAAAITSLIQSAKLNGLDPYAYLKDVLERRPTQRAREVGQLLPHRWAFLS